MVLSMDFLKAVKPCVDWVYKTVSWLIQLLLRLFICLVKGQFTVFKYINKLSLNKDWLNCSLTNKVIIQTTNYPKNCSVPYVTTQAFYIGLYHLVPIVQWYYALQHRIAATCSTVHSTLVLWQLPIALNLVHWVRRAVVQLFVATYYNCTHAKTFPGHGTT